MSMDTPHHCTATHILSENQRYTQNVANVTVRHLSTPSSISYLILPNLAPIPVAEDALPFLENDIQVRRYRQRFPILCEVYDQQYKEKSRGFPVLKWLALPAKDEEEWRDVFCEALRVVSQIQPCIYMYYTLDEFMSEMTSAWIITTIITLQIQSGYSDLIPGLYVINLEDLKMILNGLRSHYQRISQLSAAFIQHVHFAANLPIGTIAYTSLPSHEELFAASMVPPLFPEDEDDPSECSCCDSSDVLDVERSRDDRVMSQASIETLLAYYPKLQEKRAEIQRQIVELEAMLQREREATLFELLVRQEECLEIERTIDRWIAIKQCAFYIVQDGLEENVESAPELGNGDERGS